MVGAPMPASATLRIMKGFPRPRGPGSTGGTVDVAVVKKHADSGRGGEQSRGQMVRGETGKWLATQRTYYIYSVGKEITRDVSWSGFWDLGFG
jgi:hypothetical protein